MTIPVVVSASVSKYLYLYLTIPCINDTILSPPCASYLLVYNGGVNGIG